MYYTDQMYSSSVHLFRHVPLAILNMCFSYLVGRDLNTWRQTCKEYYSRLGVTPAEVVIHGPHRTCVKSVDVWKGLTMFYRLPRLLFSTDGCVEDSVASTVVAWFPHLHTLVLNRQVMYLPVLTSHSNLTTLHVETLWYRDVLRVPLQVTDLNVSQLGDVYSYQSLEMKKAWDYLCTLPLTRFDCRHRALLRRELEERVLRHFASTLTHLGWLVGNDLEIISRFPRLHFIHLRSLSVYNVKHSGYVLDTFECPSLQTLYMDAPWCDEEVIVTAPVCDARLPASLTSLTLGRCRYPTHDEWAYLFSTHVTTLKSLTIRSYQEDLSSIPFFSHCPHLAIS